MKETNFHKTFERLQSILQPYVANLVVKENQSENYVLISPKLDEKKKEVYFAALQIKKNYVSFHFMPVYLAPELLADITPALKKRMQGKSCFNFTEIDDKLLGELSDLTKKGFEFYQQKEML